MAVDQTHDESDATPHRFNGRCVVLSPPGATMLGALMRALSGRWSSLSVVADEPGVMVELAAGGVSMLVVVEPDRWAGLRPLAHAIGQYYGDVLCMQFDADAQGQSPRIRALASRWLDPNVFALATLEESARDRSAPPDDHPPEQAGPLDDAAAAPRPSPAAATGREQEAPSAGGILVGPPTQATPRRRKVQNLVVHVPLDARNGNTIDQPLVTEEELSMLLGPPPAETA
ncbi:MAG: hypothetical protein ACIAXF_12500 [Phycisphaerales bacterium JB063]